jgi:hypothetical protein
MCQRSCWSYAILRGVLGVVLRDDCKEREKAAIFLGRVEQRGDCGGEVGELEVDGRLGDFSPKFGRRTESSGSRSI